MQDLHRKHGKLPGSYTFFPSFQTYALTSFPSSSGNIVRIGPNELSFATPEAYRDIYGHATGGKKRFLKSRSYERAVPRITSVRDPAEHAQQRKALANAFSAKALRDQEGVVHQYVDLLLQQLGNFGAGGQKPVNVTDAYNWLTFDIIGLRHYRLVVVRVVFADLLQVTLLLANRSAP